MAPNHGCLVKKIDCSVVVKVKVTGKVKNSIECSSQRYLLNAEPFETKLGVVMYIMDPSVMQAK